MRAQDQESGGGDDDSDDGEGALAAYGCLRALYTVLERCAGLRRSHEGRCLAVLFCAEFGAEQVTKDHLLLLSLRAVVDMVSASQPIPAGCFLPYDGLALDR